MTLAKLRQQFERWCAKRNWSVQTWNSDPEPEYVIVFVADAWELYRQGHYDALMYAASVCKQRNVPHLEHEFKAVASIHDDMVDVSHITDPEDYTR